MCGKLWGPGPQIFEDQLLIVGMPNTLKFRDLERDPRFCLHTP
jgi:hypothetical protein